MGLHSIYAQAALEAVTSPLIFGYTHSAKLGGSGLAVLAERLYTVEAKDVDILSKVARLEHYLEVSRMMEAAARSERVEIKHE